MLRRIELRQMADILTMFLIVQFAGLLIAAMVITTTPISQITGTQVSTSNSFVLLFYVVYIIVTAIILIYVSKKFKGRGSGGFLKIIEALVIFTASFIVFSIAIGYILPANFSVILETIIAAGISAALVFSKLKNPKMRNIAALIASVGVGVILGLDFSFIIALAFMAIIAVYDYIAVFITKHMISLAQAVSENNLAFLIGTTDVEAAPTSYFTKKEKVEYKKAIKESGKDKDPVFQKLMDEGKMPMVSQIQLGTGDLALPLMLAVSAYAASLGIFTAIVIVCGALVGLAFTMYFLKKYNRPLPAIPPLFSFMCIALGIEFAFMGQYSLLISIGLIIAGALTMLVGIVLTLRAGIGATKAKKTK